MGLHAPRKGKLPHVLLNTPKLNSPMSHYIPAEEPEEKKSWLIIALPALQLKAVSGHLTQIPTCKKAWLLFL